MGRRHVWVNVPEYKLRLMKDGRAVHEARVIKTVDELQLIRWTTQAKAKGYDLVRGALRKADPPEDQLSRIMVDYLMDQGFEAGSEFISIYDSSTIDSRLVPSVSAAQ